MSKNKGTVKTELIIGTAATKLSAAVKSIMEAGNTAKELESQLTDYNTKATAFEDKIAGLETEYSQKKAEREFQLNLDYKTAQKAFAEKFLNENHMIAVVVEEDQKLRNDYNMLKNEFDNRVNVEIGKAKGMASAEYSNKIGLMEADYKAREAGNLAKIETLTAQLAFANDQAKEWRMALDKEREASVERSKHGAVGNINVSGPSK